MATTYEYILKLNDKSSAIMQKIVGTSNSTIDKLKKLNEAEKVLNATTKDLGGSIYDLKQRIDVLQQKKELLNPANITQIKTCNAEINKLTRQVEKLDNAGEGKLKGYFKELKSSALGVVADPLMLGAAAIGFMGKSAMGFDEGMAKVNITAQLEPAALKELKGKVKQIAKDNKADITIAPIGFEKIISQTGEVNSSLQILDASLKGSKAGFVDLDVISGALAQSLSIIGTNKTSAQEVLDTFFAAKRIGAGEFADFANYMPTLIAGAANLGIAYKDVAGIFAYMTGKGQKAEKASVLMENMFSVLGKGDIRENLSLAGIDIFNKQGEMRNVVDIFSDMQRITSQMSGEKKASFLEKMGIVDKEAKNAIAIMMADIDKLRTAMDATNNSTGETAKALEFSSNSTQQATELWNQFKGIAIELGITALPIINTGLTIFGGIIDVIAPIVAGVVWIFDQWFTSLAENDPLIWGLTGALTALTIGVNAATIATKAKALWSGIVTGATWLWSAAQAALNAVMHASPLVWVIALVIGIAAAIYAAWQKFEGFRKVVLGTWEVIKGFGKLLFDSVLSTVTNLISGLGSLGSAIWKLFSGDFKGAAQEAKNGALKILAANPIVATVGFASKMSNADWKGMYNTGAEKGAQSWAKSQQDAKPEGSIIPDAPAVLPPGVDFDLGKFDKKSKNKGANSVDLDNNKIANLKGSTLYSAITSRLAPVKVASLASAAASLAMPMAVAATTLPTNGDMQMQATEQYAESGRKVNIDTINITINNANIKDSKEFADMVAIKIQEVLSDEA